MDQKKNFQSTKNAPRSPNQDTSNEPWRKEKEIREDSNIKTPPKSGQDLNASQGGNSQTKYPEQPQSQNVPGKQVDKERKNQTEAPSRQDWEGGGSRPEQNNDKTGNSKTVGVSSPQNTDRQKQEEEKAKKRFEQEDESRSQRT